MASLDNLEDGTKNKNAFMKKSLNNIKDMVENIEKVVKEPTVNNQSRPTKTSAPTPTVGYGTSKPSVEPKQPDASRKKKKKTSFLSKPEILFIGTL